MLFAIDYILLSLILGDTIVLAAAYGPKAGTKKGENPEKASIEVIWKPKTGQIGISYLLIYNFLSDLLHKNVNQIMVFF